MLSLSIFCFAAGAIVGSFLNVVAYRLPRGESVVTPRSRCPGCEKQIAGYDNVPICSWLALRGRCRSCQEPISGRYPLVELVTGLSWLAAGLAFADRPVELVLALVFLTVLVAVSVIDLEFRIIPNRILAIGAVSGLALIVLGAPDQLDSRVLACLAAGVPLFTVAMIFPGGMGMGDAKLAAVMGLFLGRAVAPALLIGFAAGALVGVGMIAARGAQARKQAIPFGPFLAGGSAVALFVGNDIVDWYLRSFAGTDSTL
ncbi:MAG: prepilin peptidase [Solirubrobacterales bacterium]